MVKDFRITLFTSEDQKVWILKSIPGIQILSLHGYEFAFLKHIIMVRPGPNILLILPIIQELYSPISTPLFKRKLPIILKKADKN